MPEGGNPPELLARLHRVVCAGRRQGARLPLTTPEFRHILSWRRASGLQGGKVCARKPGKGQPGLMIGVNSPGTLEASYFRNWRSLQSSLLRLPWRLLAASPRIRNRHSSDSRRRTSRRERRPTRRPGPTPRRLAPSPRIRHICRTSAPARTYRRRASASSRSTKRPARRRMRRPGPTPRRPAPPRPIRPIYKVSAAARMWPRRASALAS